MTAMRSIPLECVDLLTQIRDELEVSWLALGNHHDFADDGPPLAIREHIAGLKRRLADICKTIEGVAK